MDETREDGIDGIATLLKRAVAETWPSVEKTWDDEAFRWFPKGYPDEQLVNIAWSLLFEAAVDFLDWFERHETEIASALLAAGMSRREFAETWRAVRTSRGESQEDD